MTIQSILEYENKIETNEIIKTIKNNNKEYEFKKSETINNLYKSTLFVL